MHVTCRLAYLDVRSKESGPPKKGEADVLNGIPKLPFGGLLPSPDPPAAVSGPNPEVLCGSAIPAKPDLCLFSTMLPPSAAMIGLITRYEW